MTQSETKQVGSISNETLNFYGTIIGRLQNKNLYSVLSEIKLVTDDEKVSLTNSQFEVIGGISYLIGLDFVAMNSWNKSILKNVFARMNINKISFKTFQRFKKLIYKFNDFEIYNTAKDNLVKRISQEIKSDVEGDSEFITNTIKNILIYSLVPNSFAELINDNYLVENKKTYTYHDILVFNNMFYENLIIDKIGVQYFIELANNNTYSKALKASSEYFEDQKFALMYMDSIISLIQKIKSINDENSWYFNDKLFEMCLDLRYDSEANLFEQIQNRLDLFEEEYKPSNKELVETPKTNLIDETIDKSDTAPLTNIVENLETAQLNPLENPTEVIKNIFYDYNKICKETFDTVFDFKNKPKELVKLLISMLTAEDIIGSFFVFLKKYAEFKNTAGIEVNKVNSEELFNYSQEELIAYLEITIEDLKAKYSDIVSKYVIDIENENKSELIEKINNLISSLSIENIEDKGILISQISDNIINTNKHLHEVLTCIDRQLIDGSKINNYIELRDLLNDKFSNELELFEETSKLEDYQLQVTLLSAFKAIF